MKRIQVKLLKSWKRNTKLNKVSRNSTIVKKKLVEVKSSKNNSVLKGITL